MQVAIVSRSTRQKLRMSQLLSVAHKFLSLLCSFSMLFLVPESLFPPCFCS